MTRNKVSVTARCVAGIAAMTLAGCESTQDKSARLEKQAAKSTAVEKGVKVTKLNPEVKVLGTTVLTDENGSAVAVRLRSTAAKTLVRVPIGIDVKDAGGKSVFSNSVPGLEPNLTSTAALAPGAETFWVNDQVAAAGKPAKVEAKAGLQTSEAAGEPKLDIGVPQIKTDAVDGIYATGFVTNRTQDEHRRLVVYCVAMKGDTVVAAGRGAIERLRVGKKQRYKIFFIGNPKGAKLTISAPATVLA